MKKKNFWKKITEHPAEALTFYCGFSILIWTLQCSLLQNILGLDILEAVTWGAQFALGHAKHPPLSGWIGYFFSVCSGHSDWGLYLAAQLCLVTGVYFVYRTLRLFFDEYSAGCSALLLYFLYYYNPSWMKFSTYFVEMALVPAAAFCFFSALEKGKRFYWLPFGILCAAGLLNKYSFVLQILAFAIIFFWKHEYRKQFFSIGPWLAVLTCVILLIPHAIWLFQHDFICFRHVSNRLQENHKLWESLLVPAILAYPFAIEAFVMFLARFRVKDLLEHKAFNRNVLTWCLIFTLTPAVVYFGLSLSGGSLIAMWFCTTFSWTGAAVVSCFPYSCDCRIFKRVFILLLIFTGIMFIATTADLLTRPGLRLHMKPEVLIDAVNQNWDREKWGPVPVVLGDRFYACAVENYYPGRPPACEINDPVFYERYRALIREKGALLIGKPDDFDSLWSTLGIKPQPLKPVLFKVRTLSGRGRNGVFVIGRLSPGCDLDPSRISFTGEH